MPTPRVGPRHPAIPPNRKHSRTPSRHGNPAKGYALNGEPFIACVRRARFGVSCSEGGRSRQLGNELHEFCLGPGSRGAGANVP
jgi:hypothetical protein